MRPGYVPIYEEPAKTLEFSPTDALRETMEVVSKKRSLSRAMGSRQPIWGAGRRRAVRPGLLPGVSLLNFKLSRAWPQRCSP